VEKEKKAGLTVDILPADSYVASVKEEFLV
jgi:hypothetical protein